MKGLSWVIQNLPGGEPVAQAWNLVTEHHTQSPALGDLCLSASIGESSEELIDNLRLILDESPHHTVQGKATFALAMQCKSFAETIEDDEEESARLLDEFNGLMEEVMAVYAEVGHFRGSLGNAAKGELFEFNNLRLGMVAPDISGEDLDGVSFKLSDYRGKVVVLDFWGNW